RFRRQCRLAQCAAPGRIPRNRDHDRGGEHTRRAGNGAHGAGIRIMSELRTPRLLLRPPRPDDAPCYALGIGEFAVARWLTHLPWPYTLSMASDWLRQAPENCHEQCL